MLRSRLLITRCIRPPANKPAAIFARCLSSAARPQSVSDLANPRGEDTRDPVWIADPAGILGPDVFDRINAQLDDLNANTGHEMAVVCVEDIIGEAAKLMGGKPGSYGHFTEWVFDTWGVGKAGLNNGVVLALYREGRRVEIRTGKGIMRRLPDSFLQKVIDDTMIVRFKAGQHAAGVEQGVAKIVRRLDPDSATSGGGARKELDDGMRALPPTGFGGGNRKNGGGKGLVPSASAPPQHQASENVWAKENAEFFNAAATPVALIALVLLLVVSEHQAEKRRRQCPNPACAQQGLLMDRVSTGLEDKRTPLPERFRPPPKAKSGAAASPQSTQGRFFGVMAAERELGYDETNLPPMADERAKPKPPPAAAARPPPTSDRPLALTPCEVDERRVGSKVFTLLRCPKCGGERVLAEEKSGFSDCSKCHCRTEEERSRRSGDWVYYDCDCKHCGASRSYTQYRPQTSSSSSSGGGGGGFGGGGGGFGGGSSGGGGGAGGSWLTSPGGSFLDTKPSEHAERAFFRAKRALNAMLPNASDGSGDGSGEQRGGERRT